MLHLKTKSFFYRGLACLILAFFAVLAVSSQTDDAPIVVDSTLVVLNATITDAKGKHIPGLTKRDFSLFEDGKPQDITFFETEKTPFAAVILLDSSGSMEQRVSLARSAAIQFLDRLRTDDVAAIYNFDSKISLVQDFSGSRDIYEGVFDIKANGMTVLNDSIVKAADELAKRPEKRRAIIVLSDGADTQSGYSADKALKRALAVNATIYTVDMSGKDGGARTREEIQNQGVLKTYAEKSGGTYIATPGGVAIRDAFRKIVDELGVQYTLGYQPTNTARNGKWRSIELKPLKTGVSIRTRRGYNAPK